MMRPYIIAVYAYLSVAQLAMAVSSSNIYDQNRMMHNTKGENSDGTQEKHDSKPGAQRIIRAKEDKGNVDTARNPGDAPLKQAEVMLEIGADGNLRVQQNSDTHDNDVDGNEKKKNKEREREINSLHTQSAGQANQTEIMPEASTERHWVSPHKEDQQKIEEVMMEATTPASPPPRATADMAAMMSAPRRAATAATTRVRTTTTCHFVWGCGAAEMTSPPRRAATAATTRVRTTTTTRVRTTTTTRVRTTRVDRPPKEVLPYLQDTRDRRRVAIPWDWDTDPRCCDAVRKRVCVRKGKGSVQINGKRMGCTQALKKQHCQDGHKGTFFLMSDHCKATCGPYSKKMNKKAPLWLEARKTRRKYLHGWADQYANEGKIKLLNSCCGKALADRAPWCDNQRLGASYEQRRSDLLRKLNAGEQQQR